MYLLILLLPLWSTLFIGFFGRKFGGYGSSLIATVSIFSSAILSYLALFEIGLNSTQVYLTVYSWFSSGLNEVSIGLLFDNLTVVMLVIITTISSLVHLYSISYMSVDPHLPRFMAYLSIFTFFMLILVTANNLVQMFLGWEGVGLASYLLINFWFTRLAANQSALKALIINRVGDFGLLLAILFIYHLFKTFDYSIIFMSAPLFSNFFIFILNYKIHAITLIGILLFIGAVGKSAQLGLHTWLPDAMEGPTPVSALIHAATMVTAGVFLIIRFSPLIEFSIVTLSVLILFGSLTAFFASITGVFQNDIKRVIAYSTCSQLGYMIFSCGISCYHISIFHLTNHAFFKALLFLSAGSVIHALSDEQDMRRMGSLKNILPISYSLMLIGSFALLGFPFLTGFYSKDFILEITQVLRNNNISLNLSVYACWLGNLSVFFTAYYSFRLLYLTFFNNINSTRIKMLKAKESSLFMLIPLIILGLGSLFLGFYAKDFFIGLGVNTWDCVLFNVPVNNFYVEAELLGIINKWIPFIFSLLGVLLANLVQLKLVPRLVFMEFFAFLISKKWYFDFFINKLIVNTLLKQGYLTTFLNIDKGFIELLGPYGIVRALKIMSNNLIVYQSGLITNYILYIIIGLLMNVLTLFIYKLNVYLVFLYLVLIFFI